MLIIGELNAYYHSLLIFFFLSYVPFLLFFHSSSFLCSPFFLIFALSPLSPLFFHDFLLFSHFILPLLPSFFSPIFSFLFPSKLHPFPSYLLSLHPFFSFVTNSSYFPISSSLPFPHSSLIFFTPFPFPQSILLPHPCFLFFYSLFLFFFIYFL